MGRWKQHVPAAVAAGGLSHRVVCGFHHSECWCVVSTIQNAWTQVFQGPGTWFGPVRGSCGSGICGSSKFLTPGLRGSLGADVGREQPLPPSEELFRY